MRPSRIVALVIGCLLVIPALALLLGGGALGLGYAFGRGDDGYFDTTIDRLATNTVAIAAEDITFAADPGSPDWVLDALDADIRLRLVNPSSERSLFIGIGREADVNSYLADVAHDEVIELTDNLDPTYQRQPGGVAVAAPVDEEFWAATASGPGDQTLEWEATSGSWSAVLMNTDGSPGVVADVNVGARAAFVLPLALTMVVLGAALTASAVGFIIAGARELRQNEMTLEAAPTSDHRGNAVHPVALNAQLDPELSRWKWLVKWFLAIPHFIILTLLFFAFAVLTLVAAVSIVFTGRYPRGIFDFNVGVLRWAWRVSFYATTGGIGSDRYPPFRLQAERGDPATLDIEYPERLSRGLVFVKWFLAIPHLIIVALLTGSSVRWLASEGDRIGFDPNGGGGLLGLLVLITGLILLFTDRYPQALFDLIVGFNRWIYRVTAYVALMTDDYPPFRLDQGGEEPSAQPTPPPPSGPTVDLRSTPTDVGARPVGTGDQVPS